MVPGPARGLALTGTSETGTRAATAGNTDRPLPSARTLLGGLDIYTVLEIAIYILH